jgi:macrolide-specific efflux system membrane fusion protein
MISSFTAVTWLAAALAWPPAAERAGKEPVTANSVTASSVHLRLIDQVEVPAQTSGVLVAIPAQEGKLVAENEVVAQIDDSDAILAAARARLDLEIAEKKSGSELKVSVARNAIIEARFAKDRAELEFEAARRLAENEAALHYYKRSVEVATSHVRRARDSRKALAASVSDAELDNLQLQLDKAIMDSEQADYELTIARLTQRVKKSDLESLELTAAQRQLDLRQAEEDAQVADLTRKVKQNDLSQVDRDLNRRKITAPLAGMVVQLHHRRGEWVQPGEKVLRILRLDRLRAEGFVQTRDLERDLLDAPVRVRVAAPGKPETEITGRVVFVSPEIDPVNSQVRIWAEIENPHMDLRPGLRATMTIEPRPAKKPG